MKCPDDPYVIGLGRAHDGKTPVSVYNEFKAALRVIGVDELGIACHSIRKMFVTERIKAGKNPEKIAALIADNPATMRRHYSMMVTNDLRDTAEL
jgi:peroxiredoxin